MNEDLHKVTLNLYRSDIEDLEHIFGYGWTVQVREWVHAKVKDLTASRPQTVGDLLRDNN